MKYAKPLCPLILTVTIFVVWNGLAYQLNQFCIFTVAAYHFSNVEKGDQFGDRMVTLGGG